MSTPSNNGPDSNTSGGDVSTDPQQIEADIARHREELGQTVDELTERLDVKKQAARKVDAVKVQAQEGLRGIQTRARTAEPDQILATVAPVLVLVAVIALTAGVVRRHRARP